MEKEQISQRNAGFLVFFLSGICAISSDVVASMLQETYDFAYGTTGTLLSLMSIGNLLTGFISGMLPVEIGIEKTVVLLTAGYGTGYLIMGFSGWMLVLMLSFFLVGAAKGSTISIHTILVADNSDDRTKGMNIIYNCYTLGVLLCSFFIGAAMKAGNAAPMLVLASCGFLLWLTLCVTPAETEAVKKDRSIDKGFLKSKEFWLLTGLLFCRDAAETSVAGWTVIYLKGNGTTSGSLSPHTVIVMWGATLIARLLIVSVVPIKNSYSAMIKMGIGCIILYLGLMMTSTQTAAILLPFAFAFAMAGMNLTTMANAGRMTSTASIGIVLPTASSGVIIMPWITGTAAEHVGIETGMASNTIPCAGMLLFSVAVKRLKE